MSAQLLSGRGRAARFPWVRAGLVLIVVLAAHALALSVARRTTVNAPLATAVTVLDAMLLAPPAPASSPSPAAPAPVTRVVRRKPFEAPPPPSPTTPSEPSAVPIEEAVAAPPTIAEPPPAAPPAAPAEAQHASEAPVDWARALVAAGGPALPASARYVYRTRMSRLSIVSASTTTTWSRLDDATYEARLETEAIGATVLRLQSNGAIGPGGLEPVRYAQQSMNRTEKLTSIDRSGRRVQFAARERGFEGALQDRLSFQFQLMALAQRLPERIVPGASIAFPVAGPDDIEEYAFVVQPQRETLMVGDRAFDTLRLERTRERNGRVARIEVWMAPELLWAPVRLRFTEADGTTWDNQLLTVEARAR